MTITIYQPLHTEINIKKSRFICYLIPIKNEQDAKQQLNKLKKQTSQATHHCFAYIVDQHEHMSDDGEPSGTAGKPILTTLQSNHLTNILAIVIRYFGGIKLGTGGLTRAYRQSVTNTLQQSTLAQITTQQELQCVLNYSQWQSLQHLKTIKIVNVIYDEYVNLTLSVIPEQINQIITTINNYLHTKINFTIGQLKTVTIPIKKDS